MTPATRTPEVIQTIGKLCVSGDWACAHGDRYELRRVVQQLAAYAPEPMHCELAEIATECTTSFEHAVTHWDRMKSKLYCQAKA